jgi:hypothetical protein
MRAGKQRAEGKEEKGERRKEKRRVISQWQSVTGSER